MRQEYAGQVSAHVHCDVARGAVITVRAGVFKPTEGGATVRRRGVALGQFERESASQDRTRRWFTQPEG